MKRVIKYETADKVLHDTADGAKRHAQDRYGEQLGHMARQIVRLEKYMAVLEFIDGRLEVFQVLAKMKADANLEPSEKECDCEE
jgi:uncharacterized Fe-S cluster-containing protein